VIKDMHSHDFISERERSVEYMTAGVIVQPPPTSNHPASQSEGSCPGLESTYGILNRERIGRPRNPATADTATTLILLDSSVVQRIYDVREPLS